jgi:hypothetical protein
MDSLQKQGKPRYSQRLDFDFIHLSRTNPLTSLSMRTFPLNTSYARQSYLDEKLAVSAIAQYLRSMQSDTALYLNSKALKYKNQLAYPLLQYAAIKKSQSKK